MGILEIFLIVLVILFLFGGVFSYSRRGDWGPAPGGILGLLLVIVLIILLFRVL